MNTLAASPIEQTVPPLLHIFPKSLKGSSDGVSAKDDWQSEPGWKAQLNFSTSYAGFTSEGSRIVFRVVAPLAWSVRQAADFTEWERNALSLQAEGQGVWQVSVPLPPGRYPCRYLVNGERLADAGAQANQAVVVVI